jgi:hypothetical protein
MERRSIETFQEMSDFPWPLPIKAMTHAPLHRLPPPHEIAYGVCPGGEGWLDTEGKIR